MKDNDSLVFGCFLEELRNWLHGEGRLRDTIGGGGGQGSFDGIKVRS